MTVLPSGQETIDYGAQGWSGIHNANVQLWEEFITNFNFFSGLQLTWTDASNISIGTGCAKDDSTPKLISVTSPIAINMPTNLDTGSEAASTIYFVWIAKNPTTGVVIGLFSTSATTPTLPAGYTLKRRIGAVVNDSGSNFITFIQTGSTAQRYTLYNGSSAATRVLAGGTATVYTPVSLALFVPTTAVTVFLDVSNILTAGLILISPDGVVLRGGTLASDSANMIYPVSQTVYYAITAGASAYIDVFGYIEDL